MNSDWSDDNGDPSTELLSVLKENINSFDNEQVETFVSAIANLSVDVDNATLEALLNSKELIGTLAGKFFDESLQIQFASLQAVNKLITIALARHKERLVEATFNLSYLQAATQQKVTQNVSKVNEIVKTGLHGSFLKDLKSVSQINSLCFQTLEKSAIVLGEKTKFAYFPAVLASFEQLVESLTTVGEESESGKLISKLVKRTIEFMLFVFEFEPKMWTSVLQSQKTQSAVLAMMKGSDLIRFEAFKIADFGQRNGLSSATGELIEWQKEIIRELIDGCQRNLSLSSEKELYSHKQSDLKQMLLLVREIDYFVEAQTTETMKSVSAIASLGTFQFVSQLLNGALTELTCQSEEQYKQDKLLYKVIEETSATLFALVQFVDTLGLSIEQSFWTELSGFYESVIPKLSVLTEDGLSKSIDCLNAVFKAFSFIFESKMNQNASLLKLIHQTSIKSIDLLSEVLEYIDDKSVSDNQLYIGEETVAEELSGLLFDLTATLLGPSNIAKFESSEPLNSLLKTVHQFTCQKSHSLMVLAQFMDGLMTLFSDDNLDAQFFGNNNWALSYLTSARQSMAAFFEDNRNKIDSDKQEYCEEVIQNLSAFIKFKTGLK